MEVKPKVGQTVKFRGKLLLLSGHLVGACEMNPRIKKLWVKALRSYEYEQTHGCIRKNDRFCCLGVLCNLHAIEHPEVAIHQTDPSIYLGNSLTLAREVVDWADVSSDNPGTPMGSLASMNDRGCSFSEIADVIEKNL